MMLMMIAKFRWGIGKITAGCGPVRVAQGSCAQAMMLLMVLLGLPVLAFAQTSQPMAGGGTGFKGIGLDGFTGQNTTATSRIAGGSAAAVKPRLVWSADQARPGGQIVLAVVIDIAEHYHINPNQPQIAKGMDYLIPLKVKTGEIPVGVLVGEAQYPKAVSLPFAGGRINGYEGQVVVYLPVAISTAYQGQAVSFPVEVGFQSCNATTCLRPTQMTFTASLPVTSANATTTAPTTQPAHAERVELFNRFDPSVFGPLAGSLIQHRYVDFNFFKYRWQIDAATPWGLVLLVLMAAIGGLLLNFTPCVLPVIPIKILSLKQSAGSAKKRILLGAAMALGVVLFWIGLGALMAVSTSFTSTNQLFQYPWFTISVGLVIIIMAMGMCGLFAVRLPGWVYRINPGHDSVHGSLGFGVMTAVLSTPCTAPLMGSAAAWAVTQSAWVTMVVFCAIGVGMALPYQILSANPKWIDRLPRTGPGSELIKQVMGLLLLAAGVFFVGSGISGYLAAPPAPPSRWHWWLVALCVAIAGAWLVNRVLRIARSNRTKCVFVPLGVLLMLIAIWGGVSFTSEGPIQWIHYTPDKLAQAKADNKIIVLEFTAEWCANCKALEQSVLNTKTVADLLNSDEVAPIKVDLTGNNTQGNMLLKQMNAVAIPLLVVLTPDGRVTLHTDSYGAGDILTAVARARQGDS
jgi:thiol:disulfide interchange protein DsbD